MKYHFEKVLTTRSESFAAINETGNVIDSVFHVHPEFELTYVLSSSGTRFIGDNISMFDREDLVLIGSMLPHHYYSSPPGNTTRSWSFLKIVKFRSDFAGHDFFQLPEMQQINTMLTAANFGLEFPLETSRQVKNAIYDITEMTGHRRLITFLEILSTLAESDYKTLSTVSKHTMDLSMDERINNVLAFIHKQVDRCQVLTLQAAADKINMSPQAFSRYFKKATRKKFIEYVNVIKIGKVCQQLLNSNKTIAEICFETGFNNLSNFNRQFMKHKNMSPKEFRKKYLTARS